MQQNKRALDEAVVPYVPSVGRKVQRSERRRCAATNFKPMSREQLHTAAPGIPVPHTDQQVNDCRMEPASAPLKRIIDKQALKIDQLEKEQLEYQKHMKAVEWAKMELQSATSANTRWKELCDQLQEQMGEAATSNLTREQELHHTVAERNQHIITLRVSQEQLKEELLEAQERVASLQTQCEGLETQAANSERLTTSGTSIAIDMECAECDRMQQQMLSSRQQVADARNSKLQAQRENEETKISLKRANMELGQAAAKTRTQELRQEHTYSLQEELSKARNELQDLLQDSKSDELIRMQQELSRKSLQCTKETARADAAEEEIQQLLDIVPQRDALKDQVATLQHALNDMQTTTGAVDVREVLQRYQARELTSEQVLEQLRRRIEQLETQEGELHEHVGTLKAKNKELEVRLSSSDSQVERLQGLQRTSAGEISFLRARLDFHLTASATAAKRDAAKKSKTGESDGSGAPHSDVIMAAQEDPQQTARLPSCAETATLQGFLDDTRQQVDQLENSKKEADEQLAAAEAARTAAEMRVEQEQKVVEQLKLALELQRLTAQAAAINTNQSNPPQSTASGPENPVHRELCDHQLLIIQRENERLRGQVLDLTKCQAEKGDKRGSDALQSPGEATGTPSHAVLTAQLAIAEQQAADYQTRMNKLSSFFSDSMQDLRVITQDVLGWRLIPRRTVGEHGATYTVACSGSEEPMLTAKRNDSGELELDPSNGWAFTEPSNVLLSSFQEGVLSAPMLCAQLLLSSAMQDEEESDPQVIE